MTEQNKFAQNIIEIYKKHGRAWMELRGNFLYEKVWLDHFLSLIPKNAKILDLGCGSARPIAAYFIEHNHTVTGVDSSDVMIEMARQNFPEQYWLQADMRIVELDQKFNAILVYADDQKFHSDVLATIPNAMDLHLAPHYVTT